MSKNIYRDKSTGLKIIQWTNDSSNDQHLYFTSHSVTSDNKWLIFISDQSGHPNLFAINRKNGEVRKLSNNNEGLLKSYVYPFGGNRGLSKASPSLDEKRNILYFNQSERIFSVDLNTRELNLICELPKGWISAFTHVSSSGKYLCVPVSDPKPFNFEAKNQVEQMRGIGEKEKSGTVFSKILLINTFSGEIEQEVEVPFWVTHVQFSPLNDQQIIFNHEGIRKNVSQRIWKLDTTLGNYEPLFEQPKDIWCSHENWMPTGKVIIYHGGKRDQPNELFIAGRNWNGDLVFKQNFNDINFAHATATLDGKHLVVDQRDGWVSIINIKNKKVVHLCELHTDFNNQDAHGHPIQIPKGTSIIFTSNEKGNCNVYELLLPWSMRLKMMFWR